MAARKRTPLHVYAELKPALQWVEELFHQTVCAPQHQCFSSDFLARIKVFLVKEAVDAFAGTVFLANGVDTFHVVVAKVFVVHLLRERFRRGVVFRIVATDVQRIAEVHFTTGKNKVFREWLVLRKQIPME